MDNTAKKEPLHRSVLNLYAGWVTDEAAEIAALAFDDASRRGVDPRNNYPYIEGIVEQRGRYLALCKAFLLYCDSDGKEMAMPLFVVTRGKIRVVTDCAPSAEVFLTVVLDILDGMLNTTPEPEFARLTEINGRVGEYHLAGDFNWRPF